MILQLYINTKLRDEITVTPESWRELAKDLRHRFDQEIQTCIQWRIILVVRSKALQESLRPEKT